MCGRFVNSVRFTPIQKTNGGYTRTPEQILEEAKKAAEAGATQILIQGGLNPDLKLDYYEKCLSLIRDNVDIWIHSLSPTEIEFIAAEEKHNNKRVFDTLTSCWITIFAGRRCRDVGG